MSRRSVGLSLVAGVCFAIDLLSFHYAVDLIGAGLGTVMGNLQVVHRRDRGVAAVRGAAARAR